MVCSVVMEWFRTTLTIFRQAVWAETCCCVSKVLCFQSRVSSTSSGSLSKKPLSVFFVANFCFIISDVRHLRRTLLQSVIAAAADARFFTLISWVVYHIDLSLPQVVTLGKNSRGYHYILANLVSNIQAASQRGSRTCPIRHAKGLGHYRQFASTNSGYRLLRLQGLELQAFVINRARLYNSICPSIYHFFIVSVY